jgi:hypothetical protein
MDTTVFVLTFTAGFDHQVLGVHETKAGAEKKLVEYLGTLNVTRHDLELPDDASDEVYIDAFFDGSEGDESCLISERKVEP